MHTGRSYSPGRIFRYSLMCLVSCVCVQCWFHFSALFLCSLHTFLTRPPPSPHTHTHMKSYTPHNVMWKQCVKITIDLWCVFSFHSIATAWLPLINSFVKNVAVCVHYFKAICMKWGERMEERGQKQLPIYVCSWRKIYVRITRRNTAIITRKIWLLLYFLLLWMFVIVTI